jgi:hypothetical protein
VAAVDRHADLARVGGQVVQRADVEDVGLSSRRRGPPDAHRS